MARNEGLPVRLATPLAVLGVAVFTVSTLLGPVGKVEPFHTWYYLLAWWPYILVAESVLARRGKSLLFQKPGSFLLLLPFSVCLWLVFECFNFRLQNWHYASIPDALAPRWTGYFLSFATVLPGIMTTKRLLQEAGLGRLSPTRPLSFSARAISSGYLVGFAFLIAPLLWPSYFFPLIWGGFVFLFEPLLFRRGEPCFLQDLRRGDWSDFCLWLYAGLICGILWETWNFWAGSKWIYTVPFVGGFEIFEMPALGFLGFPPFALECIVLVRVFYDVRSRMMVLPPPQRKLLRYALAVAAAAFMILVFTGIDQFTVVAFVGSPGP
jgi:hypothetical protein